MSTVTKLSMAALVAAFVALGTSSAARGATIGGRLFSTGGEVSVRVLPTETGYTSELRLYSPESRYITTNWETGRVVNLGSFAAGVELMFGIYVRNTGNTFLMGSGSRNADGVVHALVNYLAPGVAKVGFEDLWEGGDRDFTDNVFEFSGGIANDPSSPNSEDVPEPCYVLGSMLVLALGARSRLKHKQQQQDLDTA